MIAKVASVALSGYHGVLIEVECDAKASLPGMQIVGMGNKAVDEARERVRSAVTQSLLDFPARKITVNLAPAELPKDGAHFDLPIAVAVLVVSGQLRRIEVERTVFTGELALDGSLRPIRGAISIAEAAHDAGYERVVLPAANARQAALIEGLEVIGATHLKEVFLHLKQQIPIDPAPVNRSPVPPAPNRTALDQITGQAQAKRALQIAAAGHHNLLINGPPGAGKTMLARALSSLLPPLSSREVIEVTKLHNLGGELDTGEVMTSRPFRAPHHTTSPVALIGGGNRPKPGEISLAHRGVLFLDELPEYPRSALEALRQPLEDRAISIARTNGRTTYPADFLLVATMNPCPCGYLGDPDKQCSCNAVQIMNYQRRLSGPLLDRIDLIITITRTPQAILLSDESLNNNQQSKVLKSIEAALLQQERRYKSSYIHNSSLASHALRDRLQLTPAARELAVSAATRLDLSTRAYFKIMRVARTIADLSGSVQVDTRHVSEALQFRGAIPH